ncbi:MAG: methenyltetrahydromethanopterin cyclohydrolase [Synergistales bacterium]|nr:methenyltetrahydromethanopterin cyclohydrolase [Synergistales bacterium]
MNTTLNERAAVLVQELIHEAEQLDVAVHRTEAGPVVVDAGVETAGSLEAGRLYAEACMSGLGRVAFVPYVHEGLSMPGVSVTVSRPVRACLASQYAGWQVSGGDYFAMASGPARILRGKEPLLEELGITEEPGVAVLTLESDSLPPAEVTRQLAADCGIPPQTLYLVVAPTKSLAASVQVVARVVETGLHKMHEVGFDIRAVKSGWGTAPLPPVGRNTLQAMGWTNDAVLYGGDVWYAVDCEDSAAEAVLERLPSSAARDFGVPFAELFKRYDGDFYQIDPLLFSPARVTLNNLATGRIFRAGELAVPVLSEEWGL